MTIDTYRHKLLSLREQKELQNQWLKKRLDTLLPALMDRAGLDCWLVVCREYNEDPVIMSLLPAPAMSARRRTVLAFFRADEGVERLTVSRYRIPGFYEAVWKPDEETQAQGVRRAVLARDPEKIGINVSDTFAFADGLSHGEHRWLTAALGERLTPRLVSAEAVTVGWLERRIPEELTAYGDIVGLGHALIATAYSSRVIHPGVTTTEDVVWWFREQMAALGVQAWFQPTVEIQAPGEPFDAFHAEGERRTLIMPGDLLHCDVGFNYLGLCTDQQQHGYVLRPGERAAPAGLRLALANANRLQELHLAAMQPGRTGNEVLAATRDAADAERIQAQIYSHPLGTHGHAAGPTIGLWDRQQGVPGRGDYPLYDDTAYSIELNAVTPVPEWDDQKVRIALEEDAVLTGGEMGWLHGRQTELHLIGK